MRKKYKGPLYRKLMSKEVLRAYEALASLRARTKKYNLPECKLDTREFICWHIKEQSKYKFKVPSVSRFDHCKGYSWDNFCLDEMANNSRESFLRHGLHEKAKEKSKPVAILDPKTKSILMIVPSIRAAAVSTKVSQRLVQFCVRGKCKNPKKFGYKYYAGDEV